MKLKKRMYKITFFIHKSSIHHFSNTTILTFGVPDWALLQSIQPNDIHITHSGPTVRHVRYNLVDTFRPDLLVLNLLPNDNPSESYVVSCLDLPQEWHINPFLA